MPLVSATVPMLVVPSRNVTLPVGLAPTMVAVRLTICPAWAGLTLDVTLLVGARIVRLAELLTLCALLASPPYCTVRVWLPTTGNFALNAA